MIDQKKHDIRKQPSTGVKSREDTKLRNNCEDKRRQRETIGSGSTQKETKHRRLIIEKRLNKSRKSIVDTRYLRQAWTAGRRQQAKDRGR